MGREPATACAHRAVVDKLARNPGQRVVVHGGPALLAQARAKIGSPLQRARRAGQAPPVDVVLHWPAADHEFTLVLMALRAEVVPNGGLWMITAKRDQRGCETR